MGTEFSQFIAFVVIAASMVAVVLRWHHAIPRAPMPVIRRPYDNQPHGLTLVGAEGRPNPMSYRVFPTYGAALVHQRRLARQGQASVVAHVDSGEVRVDFATMFGPFGRLYY